MLTGWEWWLEGVQPGLSMQTYDDKKQLYFITKIM